MKETFKERINKKMIENKKSMKDLVFDLYNLMEKEINFKIYDNVKGNYSRKINGERKFTNDEIPYIEEILHTSFSYLELGNEDKPSFYDKGIRYLAYKDDYKEYETVDKTTFQKNNIDCSILFGTDEFDKSLIDYILEYESINGIKYLIDKDYLTYRIRQNAIVINYGYFIDDYPKRILKLICKHDMDKYFNKIIKVTDLLTCDHPIGIFNDDEVLDAILNTKKIFNSLLTDFKYTVDDAYIADSDDKVIGLYINPVLNKVVNYAISKNTKCDEKILKALDFGYKHNEKVVETMYKQQVGDALILDDGYVSYRENSPSLSLMFKLNEDLFSANSEINNMLYKIKSRLNSVDFSIEDDFDNYLIKSKQILRVDGYILKPKSNNKDEYDFLNILEKEKYFKAPKIRFGIKDGYDAFSEIEGTKKVANFNGDPDFIFDLLVELKKFNEISKKYLPENKVYVHGNLKIQNVLYKEGEINGIISFDKTYIGEEYEDFLYLFFKYSSIKHVYSLNDKTHLEFLIQMLNAYKADEEFVSDFYNKLKNYAIKLRDALDLDENYPNEFKSLSDIYTWAEYNKEQLNKLKDYLV